MCDLGLVEVVEIELDLIEIFGGVIVTEEIEEIEINDCASVVVKRSTSGHHLSTFQLKESTNIIVDHSFTRKGAFMRSKGMKSMRDYDTANSDNIYFDVDK